MYHKVKGNSRHKSFKDWDEFRKEIAQKHSVLWHVNRLGWTALMEAIVLGDGSKKYREIVRILKYGGADMEILDHDATTYPKARLYRNSKNFIRVRYLKSL